MNQIQQFIEYISQAIKIWVIIQPWESGLIVRAGKKIRKVEQGIYFKIPYIDSVYVQEKRLRVVPLPVQNMTTKDGETITINASIGYKIQDLEKLFQTLYRPEMTISNIVMSEIAEAIHSLETKDLSPKKIENSVNEKIDLTQFGLKQEYLKIINYAVVKTFRLIQDQSWVNDGMRIEDKKK